MKPEDEILLILKEIRGQNQTLIARIDELEQTATKRGAIAGSIAGGISGAVISVGIEIIKAKFGG